MRGREAGKASLWDAANISCGSHEPLTNQGLGMKQKTKAAAFGKWGSILGHLGYGALLDGKHQDCPICAAKKKFRFTDYKSNGDWICTCSAGDGFDLVMRAEGINFNQAAKLIDGIIGSNDLEETFKPEVDYEKRRRDLNELWARGDNFGIVLNYLNVRGIDDHGTCFKGLTDLRGTSELYNPDTGQRQHGMLALIRNKAGEPISIHRTFFDPKAKKIMPPTEKISGAGVRLGWTKNSAKKILVVGEGIETTVAGMAEFRIPGLAAISAHGMETLIIPKIFSGIIILSDNDRSFTGQKAAFTLARRMDAEKRTVSVRMSGLKGEDFLDLAHSGSAELAWNNVNG